MELTVINAHLLHTHQSSMNVFQASADIFISLDLQVNSGKRSGLQLDHGVLHEVKV